MFLAEVTGKFVKPVMKMGWIGHTPGAHTTQTSNQHHKTGTKVESAGQEKEKAVKDHLAKRPGRS